MALNTTYSHMFTNDKVPCTSKPAKLNQRNIVLHESKWLRKCTKTSLATETTSSIETQLEALDSYFNRLQDISHKQNIPLLHSTDSEKKEAEPSSMDFTAEKELDSLRNYLVKLNDYERKEANKIKSYEQSKYKDAKTNLENTQVLPSQEETSGLYLICVLASINIAVFLFEIATPVKNSDVELLTLPSLYGAKINELILNGEWWRLVTPMFLHSGILHVALGFWVLLTFGPRVCKGYGSFTFFLIYILGGISGNLTSYIHTPEPTVGGTGPVFAIIGAWIIYQIQNKDLIQKDVAESLFRKAVVATALSFVLSSFGPIDDWTHLGAVCVGIAYGFLTCPTLQVDDSSSKTDQKNGVALVRQYTDPLKSIAIFGVFIVVLGSLLLFVEPQVNTLENSFL